MEEHRIFPEYRNSINCQIIAHFSWNSAPPQQFGRAMSKSHGIYVILLNSDKQDIGGYYHAKNGKRIISMPGMQTGKKAK
jgi:hypothetical protein